MFDLDAPTVFRVGSPTLGVPSVGLDYRSAQLVPPPVDRLAELEARVLVLETTIADLQAIRPWYRRLVAWLRARWQDLTAPGDA